MSEDKRYRGVFNVWPCASDVSFVSDTVEQIKSRLDIAEVISGYLKVQKAGRNWKARCPFHNEKTPSFHISPERQTWHCFGCNRGGDLFSFVQEIEGIEFVEALRILAQRAGVEVPEYRPQDRGLQQQRQRFLAVAELAAKFFETQLWKGAAGEKALGYLRERGMDDATAQTWRIGWAPNDWRALTGFLRDAGHAEDDIVAVGVAIRKNNRVYDRFRSRIMFPVTDHNNQVVGFAGRVFGAEVAVEQTGEEHTVPKYVNTPQSPIYDKSSVVFGLHHAKQAMRSQDRALLVEGNMDAIMSWQAGAAHSVATSGTALTTQQLRLLARFTTNLDFCFDTDQAGQAATRRGIGAALAQNFNVGIVSLDDPECKDPADYVKKHGARWVQAATTAKPALQYYYDVAMTTYDSTSVNSKKALIASLGPLINRITSRVEQSHWIGQLAATLRTDQESVRADIARVKDDLAYQEAKERIAETQEHSIAPQQQPLDPSSQELLTLVVCQPSVASLTADVADMVDERIAPFLQDPKRMELAEGQERTFIDIAHIRAGELYGDFTEQELTAQTALLCSRIRQRSLLARCVALQPRIVEAEQQHDMEGRNQLLKEFQSYTEELNRLRETETATLNAS